MVQMIWAYEELFTLKWGDIIKSPRLACQDAAVKRLYKILFSRNIKIQPVDLKSIMNSINHKKVIEGINCKGLLKISLNKENMGIWQLYEKKGT